MKHARAISKILPTGGLRRSLGRLSDYIGAHILDGRACLKTARVMRKIARLIIQIEQENGRVTLKANMLKSSGWRARVLRDLGGVGALSRWEASLKRSKERRNIRPAPPTWFEERRRAERNAERRRIASFAPSHPLIFKDKIRMDFEGQFRLAPLPRRKWAREQSRARREIGALKLWGRDTSDMHRRRRPEKLNPIALLPRELRGYGAPLGGPAPSSLLIPALYLQTNTGTGMSGNRLMSPAFSNAQSLIRAGPTAA